MPNLNDFSPDERQAYLNWLQKKQAASEGLMSQAASDMAGLEDQYTQNKPSEAAMQDAARSDNFGGAAYRLMAALNSGMGNQGAAQVYGSAAKERPQSSLLEDKNKQFLDYLKGLSGMQAQRYGVAIPAAQRGEANATEALGNYDKMQASSAQRELDRQQAAEREAVRLEDKRRSDELNASVRREGFGVQRELAGAHRAVADAAKADAVKNRSEKADEDSLQKMTKEIGSDPEQFFNLLGNISARIGGLDKKKSDLPGVGRIAGKIPDWMTSQDGLDLRSDLKALTNALLKLQSGTGVSQAERDEAQKLQGLSGASEAQIYQGLERAKQLAESAIHARTVGFKPEVVQMYVNRGGITPEAIRGVGHAKQQQPSPTEPAKMTAADAKAAGMSDREIELLKASGDIQ